MSFMDISIIVCCIGIIGSLIFIIATSGIKYPLTYSTASPIGLGVTCMDLRFAETNHLFLRQKYGTHSYDNFVVPGPALALGKSINVSGPTTSSVDPEINTLLYAKLVDGTGATLVDETFYNAFIKAFQISAIVNDSEELVLIEHEDCGYYNAVAAGSFNSTHTMKQSQLANLATVRAQLSDDWTIPESRIKCYWIGLDGNVQTV